jgi:RNA polymerase sigma factor (TIGR02999 family)
LLNMGGFSSQGSQVESVDPSTANSLLSASDNSVSAEELLPLVYDQLRKLAAARIASEWETCTLQPTALVHEAWLRLAGAAPSDWKNRGHFFAAAAEAMRRVLIERARRKMALKRGRRVRLLDLDHVDVAIEADDDSLIAMDEALEKLALEDPEAAELVKLRFFVGLEYSEVARALGISERTAKRCWAFARAWLFRELSEAGGQN